MGARMARRAGRKGVCMSSISTGHGLTRKLNFLCHAKAILDPSPAPLPTLVQPVEPNRLYQPGFGSGSNQAQRRRRRLPMDPQSCTKNRHRFTHPGAVPQNEGNDCQLPKTASTDPPNGDPLSKHNLSKHSPPISTEKPISQSFGCYVSAIHLYGGQASKMEGDIKKRGGDNFAWKGSGAVTWEVQIAKAGEYAVSFCHAAEPGAAGQELEIAGSGGQLNYTMRSTEG